MGTPHFGFMIKFLLHMAHRRHVLVLFLSMALATTAAAPSEQTRRRLEGAVRFLAHDLLEGRGTPGRGLDIAALYLASELQAAGWKPGNGESYYQNYPVSEFSARESRYQITLNGTILSEQDYILLPFGIDPKQTPRSHPLVYAGHGIVAPENGIDHLAGIDVAGKAVVSLFGAPWELDGAAPFGYDRASGKSIAASGRGAGLLIYVTPEIESIRSTPTSAEAAFMREARQASFTYLPGFGGPTMGLGAILAVTPAAFDRTLARAAGGSYRSLQSRLAADSFQPVPLDAVVEISIEAEIREAEAPNVVAVLPGSDPALREEWVVLSAHFDHLGSRPAGKGEDGIWNGADDNASGTASVLELARRLAEGPAPRRSVLVFLTSGEDRGLLGSAHYSLHPIVPFSRVAVNINVDMVGRSTGSVQGIAPVSPELFQRAVETGRRHGITVEPDQQPSFRVLYLVDSYHFARFDVPIIEFFTGLHPDYHQPSDEADAIHYDEMARIFEVILDLTRFYVDGGRKPGFERPQWFQTVE